MSGLRFFLISSVLLFGLGLFNPSSADQSLDATESAIVDWSETQTGEAIELLETLVNINSGSLNQQGVREVGAVLRTELDALGFETRWIDFPAAMKRGGHLFGERAGNRGKKILLIGHLDTVFEPDDAFQTFSRDGSIATGPGVEDMKSGDVIIIYALKALQQAGVLDGSQIMVAFTGDEESTGKPLSLSRKELIEAGKWADVALGFEAGIDSEDKEWVTISRRSSSNWCLEVSGKQAHSAGIFNDRTGAGAIFEAARILQEFYTQVRGEQYLTFNAGTILGGTDVVGDCSTPEGKAFGKTNVVPNRVIVRGGMRTISQQQLDEARAAMRAVVARSLPKTRASITFTDSYPPMAPTAGNHQLAEMLSRINVDLGREPMPILDASRRGAADISFVAPYTDGLAGMGAYGKGGHTPNESLDLDSLPVAIQRAAILIYRLSRQAPATIN
ncbi:MAG: M20/M25/M40 family metallo-hydrolase [Gammaproteobacteria bacterium]|nr:M20/M25/M40 family metallo-hydrolase [Gammaproteobacteria bacterium]